MQSILPLQQHAHVIEGKKGGEGEESKGENVGGRRGVERLGRREVLVSVGLGGSGLRNRGKKRADKKNVQRAETNNREQ